MTMRNNYDIGFNKGGINLKKSDDYYAALIEQRAAFVKQQIIDETARAKAKGRRFPDNGRQFD